MIFRFSLIVLTLMSITMNILLCTLLFLIHNNFQQKMVYDLDKVRVDYVEDMRRTYIIACQMGIEYPQEYKKATIEWNNNSPINWCNKQLEDFESTIESWLLYFGRKK